ncbi:hypothetical protein Pmani_004450 [Petrolisthes manimaculis]|uniref:Uncharacterized protein n=1 Tax=Petrolisthes manimaculis TaxID=1843537 RepID=A0AAE1QDP0_9EUCA|nr:hypothetical protein Pmani_004450 [Petrolisthes manimaculis]
MLSEGPHRTTSNTRLMTAGAQQLPGTTTPHHTTWPCTNPSTTTTSTSNPSSTTTTSTSNPSIITTTSTSNPNPPPNPFHYL